MSDCRESQNMQKKIKNKNSHASKKECFSHSIKKNSNTKDEECSETISEYCSNCGSIQANQNVKNKII